MKKRIWFIDADESVCQVVARMSESLSEDFKVETISSPVLVDEKLKTGRPGVIFVDMSIAAADGGGMIRDFKVRDDTRGIPVIVMMADINIEEKARELGADGFLRKPFDIREFLSSAAEHHP